LELLTGALAGLAAAASWAYASHLFSRSLARGDLALSAPAINWFKNSVALLCIGSVALLAGGQFPADERIAWLLGSGLLGFALGDSLYFAAFPLCGVQLAAMSANLVPPLAAAIAYLAFGERLTWLACLGIALSLAGIAWVLLDRHPTADALRPPADRRRGLCLAGANALCQAVGIVIGRVGFEGVELLPGTVLRLVGGVGGAVLCALLLGGRRGPAAAVLDLTGAWRRAAAARALLLGTALGAVFNLPLHSHALGTLSPGVSAILFATTPLWTLPIGLRLGERYGWRTAAGTLLGFGGVALVVLGAP
jgi:drug/metabolite transporter (DMT)-like permease